MQSTSIQPIVVKELSEDKLNVLVSKIKKIEFLWKRDTINRYRECGQLILQSGYDAHARRQGTAVWSNRTIRIFLSKTGMSRTTFQRMIHLARMSEKEIEDRTKMLKNIYGASSVSLVSYNASGRTCNDYVKHLRWCCSLCPHFNKDCPKKRKGIVNV